MGKNIEKYNYKVDYLEKLEKRNMENDKII